MEKVIDLFRSFVSDKNMRNTPEREEIVREIFAEREHFDVDELYLRLRRKRSRVSKASIYRNLPLIMECGLIREVWHEDGHMHYEPLYGVSHHCHLRCIKCGEVIEFIAGEIKMIERRLAEKHNFDIIDHRLNVVGLCSKCRNEREGVG